MVEGILEKSVCGKELLEIKKLDTDLNFGANIFGIIRRRCILFTKQQN
jgi:hypothetical protein